MKVSLEGSTNTMIELADMLKFSQDCARQCYSPKQFCDIKNEDSKPKLLETLLNKGHHSVFGHVHLTFSLAGIPKTLAMILNNEKAFEAAIRELKEETGLTARKIWTVDRQTVFVNCFGFDLMYHGFQFLAHLPPLSDA